MTTSIVLSVTCGFLCILGQNTQPANHSAVQPTPPATEQLTDAERIVRAQRAVASDQALVDEIVTQLEDPKSTYRIAETAFKTLDTKLAEKKRDAKRLSENGEEEAATKLEEEIKKLEPRWEEARDRFNLAIQERKLQQEKIAALKDKITRNKQLLERLTNLPDKKPDNGKTDEPAKGKSADNGEKPPEAPKDPPTKEPAPEPVAPEKSPPTTPVSSKELEQAKEIARAKEQAAKEAKERALSLTALIESLRRSITLEDDLLINARQRTDRAYAALKTLEDELVHAAVEDPKAVKSLTVKIEKLRKEHEAARNAVRATSDRILELQNELALLQAEELSAQSEAGHREQEAADAQGYVDGLQNPFSVRNVLQWLLTQGPKLLLILLGMWVLYKLVRLFSSRVVQVIVHGGSRGTLEERENRAQTLVGVFRNTASLIVLSGGTVMFLDVAGIPVIPLMGGAAVVGLAVAFGAQNLVRDYFAGFMVLLEDQYCINDVVRIGSTAGMVEKISMRMTVLRDVEGVVHFIPHGTIATVSNLTHGWSRALFDIGVAYKEDVDRVMRVLTDLGKQIRQDPKFSSLILEDPEMLGVDSFGESAVVIRFFIKTKPLKQWMVKRELLRRIKNKFDELKIEIPFPHRTVYHRRDELGDGSDAEIAA